MDKSHALDLLGHVIAAHHPTPQFQVDGLDGHVVTIRWDHDAVAGGRGERHCFVNPWRTGKRNRGMKRILAGGKQTLDKM